MKNRDSSVSELCKELGITRPTLYRYIAPDGLERKCWGLKNLLEV